MKKTGLFAVCLTIGAAALALAPAMAAQAAPQAAKAKVAISEIWYNSPGKDTGSNLSLNHEWVELHNNTARAVSLANWTLRDKAGHVYKVGALTLKAHASVRIHTGHGANTATNLYWRHSWYIWNNNGDTATLKTAAGVAESRCAYSDPSEVRSSVPCSQKAITG
jgi:Lamin Tail Domain